MFGVCLHHNTERQQRDGKVVADRRSGRVGGGKRLLDLSKPRCS